ncbi:MAG: DUF559 domain-containing protein [Leeuwenhoekiella sp.]
MNYDHNAIEAKWQKYWEEHKTFKAKNPSSLGPSQGGESNLGSPSLGGGKGEDQKPFYVLDMFPYPSGAGLHVGHPLGYIASDIYARYKRHQGFNVLHPQGYDSFGLPAEQYAIQTGQHPADTTEINIEGCLDDHGKILPKYVKSDGTISEAALIDKQVQTHIDDKGYQENIIKGYRRQLDKMGFSFDWDREVRTSDPEYYKWTQWIFIQLFESWYNNDTDKAEHVDTLIARFEKDGNASVIAVCDEDVEAFTAEDWNSASAKEKQEILLKYRLTYLAETEVNWCPALGTVLANDEIVNGVSERGGHPVVRKKMTQWSMRISAYAQRLLDGLKNIDWPQPLKDSQTNWIGRSKGAMVTFPLAPKGGTPSRPGYLTGGNNSALLLEKAKKMRSQPTEAEKLLWEVLSGKKLGAKFRRQHIIDEFIVDFACLSRKLVIEVDGSIHGEQAEQDAARTLRLNEKGFRVIRFENIEIFQNLEEVLNKIKEELSVPPSGARGISVFTTRPDTIFGVTFMTLAPELDLVQEITTPEQKAEVDAYIEATAKRSERDRMADVKTITGAFTGAYAEHPFTKEPIPIWIGDYVLAGYGTGAVMAVPCGDQRDWDFARHFEGQKGMPPIKNIFEGVDISEQAYGEKDETKLKNSDFLNGLSYKKALPKAIEELEELGAGKGKINYRLRDAVFSRQRYWGEPFPVYYKDGMPQMIDAKYLPLRLPEVEKYLPTEEGEPPLGRATQWHWNENTCEVVSVPEGEEPPSGVWGIELNTMPGWAGSSWYFFRYMEDAKRGEVFASAEAMDYWKNVDLYIGGSEHATGHLLYSRFWVKFLKDRGFAPVDEPFKKLINQGMILGESAFVYRIIPEGSFGFLEENYSENIDKARSIPVILSNKIHKKLPDNEYRVLLEDKLLAYFKKTFGDELFEFNITLNNINEIHAPVDFVNISNELDIEAFKNWRPEFKDAIFIGETEAINNDNKNNNKYIVGREVEKMSKSKYNVVNPDDICEQYGADTLRMYEMFLGPLEQAKPWNTAGITGVHNFLKKLWKLYQIPLAPEGGTPSALNNENGSQKAPPSGAGGDSLKVLHNTIKKVQEDIENFSFNTSVSTFMIAVNELTAMKCTSREVLEPLLVLISPYAPHIAEELWSQLGHEGSISRVPFPKYEEKYTVESTKTYPISFNGKMKFTHDLPLDLSKEEIEKTVMALEETQKYLNGRTPKKVIVVPGKIVNIVG